MRRMGSCRRAISSPISSLAEYNCDPSIGPTAPQPRDPGREARGSKHLPLLGPTSAPSAQKPSRDQRHSPGGCSRCYGGACGGKHLSVDAGVGREGKLRPTRNLVSADYRRDWKILSQNSRWRLRWYSRGTSTESGMLTQRELPVFVSLNSRPFLVCVSDREITTS